MKYELPPHIKLDTYKDNTKKYGVLEIDTKNNQYKITADRHIMVRLSQMFNYVASQRKRYHQEDYVSLPITRHTTEDLNWLMLKYPLEIKDMEVWESELDKSKNYYKKQISLESKHKKLNPSKTFIGELYDFQKKGLAFMKNNKRCLLADEMGLGKTVQAIATIDKANKFPVLIVVPPHLLEQWKSEIRKFLGNDINIETLQGLTPYDIGKPDIILVHYLIMRGWYQELIQKDIKVVILDECQEIRKSGSQKYNSILSLVEASPVEYVFGLSGTPIYNYVNEIWNVFRVINPSPLGSAELFKSEWINPIRKSDYEDRKKIIKALSSFMEEEGMFIRRRKSEVLDELPEKTTAIQKVGLDRNTYINYMDDAKNIIRELPKREKKEIPFQLMTLANSIRHATGISKAPHVASFVENLLEAEQPTLLFAYHKTVMEYFRENLKKYNPRFITGSQTLSEKHKSQKDFQEGRTNLLTVSPRSPHPKSH